MSRGRQLQIDLQRALERKTLQIHYQPIVSLPDGAMAGTEALLRWDHHQHGLISAADFVPLAEETGLIVSIGEWLLLTACAQTKRWHDAGFSALRLAVNFSPRQFLHENFRALINKVLDETGLAAQSLELEITESRAIEDINFTMMELNDMSAMGIRLALDDFGTGYSSLSWLKHFPINTLKIDQTFTKDVITNPDDSAMVSAIIAMAHTLNLKVVAEGVETCDQLEFLRTHQCDEAQGNLLSPPLPAGELTELLEHRRPFLSFGQRSS
jgi:EAL domain-containing protein (putative c-di-GMP-specific phosphodiesterase class I)